MTNTTRPAEEDGGNGWTGWACQYPGKLPRLYGAREIAELNFHPDEGDRLFQVREVAPGAAAASSEEQATTPEWMTCSSRAPWVANSLRRRAQELRGDEKRSRGAYQKDFMGAPARYFADALGDAAAAIEARLRVVEAARAAQAQGGA